MIYVVITAQSSQPDWDFILCNFAPDVIFVHGDAGEIDSTVLGQCQSINGPEDLPLGVSLVLLAPDNGAYLQGDESLAGFVHPENVAYWFGSDSNHIQAEVFNNRAPDHIVYIPTDSIDQMYAAASWAVVSWDRRSKGG